MEDPSSGVSLITFIGLIGLWYMCTLVSNMSGKHYVKASLDAITPTTVSMGVAAVAYIIRHGGFIQKKPATSGSSLQSILYTKTPSEGDNGRSLHRWAIGLGLIQFLATALSYSSFALSSVSWTYCFRTLEPLISALLQFCAAREVITVKEFGALLVLVFGIITTVTAGSEGQSYAAWLGGLALCATVIYSCRSVIGSRVMKWYGCSGSEAFLLASTYGFGFSVWLQVATYLVIEKKGSLNVTTTWQLLIAGIFHCIYNLMSFKILHILQPVAHGVCNTVKRVFMVVISAFISGHMLSAVQLGGVFVANIGAGVFGLETKNRREREKHLAQSQSCKTDLDASTGAQGLPVWQNKEEKDRNGSYSFRNICDSGMAHTSDDKVAGRLAAIGGFAVVAGMMFLVVSLQALHIQSLGFTSSRKGNAVFQYMMKPEHTGVSQSQAPSSVHVNGTERLKCLADVKQEIDKKMSPIFQEFTSPVLYMDVANHPYGHGVMLLGAAMLVAMHGSEIEGFCALPETDILASDVPSFLRCNDLEDLEDEETLVLLGSSSVWGDHNANAQEKRIGYFELLNATKNGLSRPFVQLPNTLLYQGSDIPDREFQVLKSFESFHLFTRDESSANYGKVILPENVKIEQCPDMGFYVGPLVANKRPLTDVLILIMQMELGSGIEERVFEILDGREITWEIAHWTKEIEESQDEDFNVTSYAEKCTQIDADLISRGSVIITDDMKTAIMSTLLNKTHILIEPHSKTVSAAFDSLAAVSLHCDISNLGQIRVNSLEEAIDKSIEVSKTLEPGGV